MLSTTLFDAFELLPGLGLSRIGLKVCALRPEPARRIRV